MASVRRRSYTLVVLWLITSLSSITFAQPKPSVSQEAVLSTHASGAFEGKLAPKPMEEQSAGTTLARMSIDKQFHGELEAASKGEMLSAGTTEKSSAGYVAMELVMGTLSGRKGSFILQHTATMNRGMPQLSITVVPDSATDQLMGLTGKMSINIVDGKHFYDFEYTLPPRP